MSAIKASTPVARLRAVEQYASRYDGDITDALHEALVATPEDVERVARALDANWYQPDDPNAFWEARDKSDHDDAYSSARTALRAMGFEVPDA